MVTAGGKMRLGTSSPLVYDSGENWAKYQKEQAKATIGGHKDLYDLWGQRLYDEVSDGTGVIVNLASKEYSKSIEKYLKTNDYYVTVIFGEMVKGKLVTKGTYAKMARGEMVSYMAENQIEDPGDIKNFDRLGYVYRDDLSNETEIAFERRG